MGSWGPSLPARYEARVTGGCKDVLALALFLEGIRKLEREFRSDTISFSAPCDIMLYSCLSPKTICVVLSLLGESSAFQPSHIAGRRPEGRFTQAQGHIHALIHAVIGHLSMERVLYAWHQTAKSQSSCSDHPRGRGGAAPGPLTQSSVPSPSLPIGGSCFHHSRPHPARLGDSDPQYYIDAFCFNEAVTFAPRPGLHGSAHWGNAANFSVWLPDPDVKTTTFHLRFVTQKTFNIGNR